MIKFIYDFEGLGFQKIGMYVAVKYLILER